ncbi:MAG: serine hydrolase [Anaerolineae bacterium]|nr:serine hydrolase [Anaerolineae bacterium]
MTVKGIGTRQRGIRIPVLSLLSSGLLLAALILFAYHLARYAQNRDLLQTDITVADIPVTGLTLQEAMATVEGVYNQPVVLEYRGNTILLNPAAIGFRVNTELLRSEVQSRLASTNNYWGDFWNYLWRRPSDPISIPLNASFREADLREFFLDLAARYDQPQSSAAFDLTTMSFGAGATGSKMDVETSIDLVRDALNRPNDRRVTLATRSEPASGASMNTLKQAITTYLAASGIANDGLTTVAGIQIIDLLTGEELSINSDVAFSAVSTIKIPIMLDTFWYNNSTLDVNIKWLQGASILCSSNSASNLLMQSNTDDNSMATGLRQTTNVAQTLGARNTFITANILVDPTAKPIVVDRPKTNPNPNFNTRADTWSQTTAEDMATLLQEIYDCAEYNSGLRAAFPDRYTQNECKQMIELMSGNIIGRLIELGVPEGTKIAHKNGWGGTSFSGANVGDAGIVYSPGRTYILSVYMWEAQANEEGLGTLKPWEAIEGISRIVYNYFNPQQPLSVARVPENPNGAIDCVMPDPNTPDKLDFNNINNGRFNPDGTLAEDACHAYPACK